MTDFHSTTSQTDRQTDRQTLEFNLPIFQKLYDFYKLLYLTLKLFPKKDRYSLGQRLDTLTLNILQLTIQAGLNERDKKLPLIEKSITDLNLLKLLLRLATDIGALEKKKYLRLQAVLQEIGRMLGGWRKSLR